MEKIEFVRMMEARTKAATVKVIKLLASFQIKPDYWVIGKLLLKSATSTGANYRATNKGRSGREFFAKLSIVIEECDETLFWLELLKEVDLLSSPKDINNIEAEFTEILKILFISRKTMNINNAT